MHVLCATHSRGLQKAHPVLVLRGGTLCVPVSWGSLFIRHLSSANLAQTHTAVAAGSLRRCSRVQEWCILDPAAGDAYGSQCCLFASMLLGEVML